MIWALLVLTAVFDTIAVTALVRQLHRRRAEHTAALEQLLRSLEETAALEEAWLLPAYRPDAHRGDDPAFDMTEDRDHG